MTEAVGGGVSVISNVGIVGELSGFTGVELLPGFCDTVGDSGDWTSFPPDDEEPGGAGVGGIYGTVCITSVLRYQSIPPTIIKTIIIAVIMYQTTFFLTLFLYNESIKI